VAGVVQRAVRYGLRHRKRAPVHMIGIDEVSRRKGQVYLTVVYALERRVLLWVGEDRTEEAVKKFFTQELGKRRCSTLRVVCMDMSYKRECQEKNFPCGLNPDPVWPAFSPSVCTSSHY